jgi:hypothetical protein
VTLHPSSDTACAVHDPKVILSIARAFHGGFLPPTIALSR